MRVDGSGQSRSRSTCSAGKCLILNASFESADPDVPIGKDLDEIDIGSTDRSELGATTYFCAFVKYIDGPNIRYKSYIMG